MGGYGSGRIFHYYSKATTGSCLSIDIRHWKREGLLFTGHSFGWQLTRKDKPIASIRVEVLLNRVILSYVHSQGSGEKEKIKTHIFFDWTDCHLGNKRPWFICPGYGCGRRAAIFYLKSGRFSCRKCCKLVYTSQREQDVYRAIRKLDKTKDKLGWDQGLFSCHGLKPKGMHWTTYYRLVDQHDLFKQKACLQALSFLGSALPSK